MNLGCFLIRLLVLRNISTTSAYEFDSTIKLLEQINSNNLILNIKSTNDNTNRYYSYNTNMKSINSTIR